MTEQRIAPSAAILLVAIVITGGLAGRLAGPGVWMMAGALFGIILRAALRAENAPPLAGVAINELPSALRERVRLAFVHLPEGDARHLLLGVINQARLLFVRSDSRFDASEEQQVRDHVAGLVDACCATAADLARLDQFTSGSIEAAARRTDLTTRAAKARELFRDRLTTATSALAELYTANVERGTPSTDRVAELTAEIAADASARAAAANEMTKLFGDR
jgi:hypothetical protein